jgi:hypothetical protein
VDGYLNKSEPAAKIRETILKIFDKHVTAMVPLFILFLPKLSLFLGQSLNG